ncbi:MAG: hypothetical protein ACREEK_23420 [Bradyrhizobium sp.]
MKPRQRPRLGHRSCAVGAQLATGPSPRVVLLSVALADHVSANHSRRLPSWTEFSPGRDALLRIDAALTSAFKGDLAANRTIEIGDRTALRVPLVISAAEELAATTLLGWAIAERLCFTLLGRRTAQAVLGGARPANQLIQW